MAKAKKFEVPKTLGACADLLYQLRQQRYEIQHAADKIKEQEREIEAHLIAKLPKDDATGVVGEMAKVRVIDKVFPVVEDWDKFYAFVARNKAYDLLQRRTNNKAIEDRWENGVQPAAMGTNRMHDTQVSCTKA